VAEAKKSGKPMVVVLRCIPAEAGFEKGDLILRLAGQPRLSIADVQWVLRQTDAHGGAVSAEVQRGDRKRDLTLTLKPGWRRRDDISWRATTWELRRMVTGGMLLEAMPAVEQTDAGLTEKGMALKAKHFGQYAPHDAAGEPASAPAM
jgi:serine protease Do